MEWLSKTSLVLASVGAINWALTTFDMNLVEKFLPTYATYVYYVVGIAGAYALYAYWKK